MCLIIIALLVAVFLFLYLNKKEDYSLLGWSSGGSLGVASGCGSGYQYPPWPTAGNCAAWIDYLSSGYPTTALRGNQAFTMSFEDQGWLKVCNAAQIGTLTSNAFAFNDANGIGLDVATVVEAVGSSGLSKQELCGVAKVITTPPTNQCQLQDYKNNYMSTMTPAVQSTLNKWLSYC
jgi:hypothetical protein